MKLEVGMYVRTPKGIAKIETIEEDRSEIYFNCDTGLSISFVKRGFTKEEMAKYYKHSYNIIDLIEVGDYVNGYYIEDVKESFVNVATGSNYFQRPTIFENDIKSIVTKEQIESMSYKVEE